MLRCAEGCDIDQHYKLHKARLAGFVLLGCSDWGAE